MPRALLFLLLALMAVGCGPYDAKKPAELAEAYRLEYGVNPPQGVTVLKARVMGRGDWNKEWLLIEAKGNAMERVVTTNFLKEMFPPDGFAGGKEKYSPDWWVLPPAEQLEFYVSTNWSRGSWAYSSAGIAIHRSTGIAYFQCIRID